MNIFYLNNDPVISAQMMVDRHVVKMVLETAQLLSTAHRILDGEPWIDVSKTGRKVKRWSLTNPNMNDTIYQATHINHPSAVWCRESHENYNWLYKHFCGLMQEYTYRYDKTHKCSDMIPYLCNPPLNIPLFPFTDPPPAMDDKYIISESSMINYQNYYKYGKVHLHKWSKRSPPDWINDGSIQERQTRILS